MFIFLLQEIEKIVQQDEISASDVVSEAGETTPSAMNTLVIQDEQAHEDSTAPTNDSSWYYNNYTTINNN